MELDLPLLLLGCGNMGRALAKGWIAGGLDPDRLWIVEPLDALVDGHQVKSVAELPTDVVPRTVVLAVKPQVMDYALTALAPRIRKDALVISIAAGIPVERIRKILDPNQPVVRAMPNTPAALGKGITGVYAGPEVHGRGRAAAEALLAAGGDVVWVESERQIDAVTAISGSGPAYFFHFVECLAAAGEKLGLAPDIAMKLARATATGAGALLDANAETEAGALREAVTSPGGTTAAALGVFMGDDRLRRLVAEATAAADRRAEELSRG